MLMFIRPLDPVWGTDIKKGCSCIIADGYWMLSDLPDYGWMIKYEGQRQNVIEDQFNKWLENKFSSKYHIDIIKTIIYRYNKDNNNRIEIFSDHNHCTMFIQR